jgi:hypothetical protein
MSPNLLSSSLAAGVVFSLMVTAQAPAQQPTPSATSQATGATSDQQKDASSPQSITVSGCVQPESSVLKPGAMGTATMGAGMGDEYVITQAKLSDTSATEKPEAGAAATQPNEPVGTSGTEGSFGKVYRLTGGKEADLKNYVGQRVEIVGMFKNADDAKGETGAVGTSGSELTKANTPEITITSVTPSSGSTGSCSAPAIK